MILFSFKEPFIRVLNYSFADYLNFTSFIARYIIDPWDEVFVLESVFLDPPVIPGVHGLFHPIMDYLYRIALAGFIRDGARALTFRLLTTSLSSLRVEVLSSQMESSPAI